GGRAPRRFSSAARRRLIAAVELSLWRAASERLPASTICAKSRKSLISTGIDNAPSFHLTQRFYADGPLFANSGVGNNAVIATEETIMKALRFEKHGNPGVLSVQDLPASVAQANEAVVRVLAASVNPSDVKNVEGRMSQTTLPRTPGRDY